MYARVLGSGGGCEPALNIYATAQDALAPLGTMGKPAIGLQTGAPDAPIITCEKISAK